MNFARAYSKGRDALLTRPRRTDEPEASDWENRRSMGEKGKGWGGGKR